MLEHELDELVPRVLVAPRRRRRGMDRGGLDPFVPRPSVDLGTALEQEAGRPDVSEEAGEAERMEAVVAVGVDEGRIALDELAHSPGLPERGCFEHIQLGIVR